MSAGSASDDGARDASVFVARHVLVSVCALRKQSRSFQRQLTARALRRVLKINKTKHSRCANRSMTSRDVQVRAYSTSVRTVAAHAEFRFSVEIDVSSGDARRRVLDVLGVLPVQVVDAGNRNHFLIFRQVLQITDTLQDTNKNLASG